MQRQAVRFDTAAHLWEVWHALEPREPHAAVEARREWLAEELGVHCGGNLARQDQRRVVPVHLQGAPAHHDAELARGVLHGSGARIDEVRLPARHGEGVVAGARAVATLRAECPVPNARQTGLLLLRAGRVRVDLSHARRVLGGAGRPGEVVRDNERVHVTRGRAVPRRVLHRLKRRVNRLLHVTGGRI